MQNKTLNILVTGVGAIIGYGIIENLKKSEYECNVIGIDIYSDAVGQYWCDKFIKGVRSDSNEFINFINTIVEEENIDLVIPGIEQDLEKLIKEYKKLSSRAKYVLNNKELHEVFNDKKKTYQFLKNEISLIPTLHFEENLYEKAKIELGLPFIMKQNISYASKGVEVISSKDEFNWYIHKFGTNCVAQKKLDINNKEFTCSIFGLGNGKFVNAICLNRELSAEGATKKAKNTSIDNSMMQTLHAICAKCKFEGPTNLQFIYHEEEYLLLEINARTSSSTSIRRVFGVNEAEMCIDYYLFNKISDVFVQKQGTVIRYIKDAYLDSDNF